MVSSAAITIHEVTKRFAGQKQPALAGVSATVPYGQITGLVGPDGAGKTTLIRLMAGLLSPDAGRILLEGRDVADGAARALLGYMPQKFGLYEELTVLENLHLYADLHGLRGPERRPSIHRLLEFAGLGPFGDRQAGRLSGGMKQKLGLACALLGKPKVLLLDEPSVGVDPVSRRQLWKMVEELTRDGMAVVWSTAYLDEAEKCARVLVLQEGRILFDGPPEQLTSRIAGKTFLVQTSPERRRSLAAEMLRRPEVADALVQGDRVRIVLRSSPSQEESLGAEATPWEPTPARFEDALLALLGGATRERIAGALAFRPEHSRHHDFHGEWMVEVQGLTKRFGAFTAVDRVSFRVRRGEIFGLLGPNGAGKSTTFKMLCGLLPPTAGRAQVAGMDLVRAPAQARAIMGYMAQKFSLYGNLSVRQNLEFFGGVYGLRGKRLAEVVDSMVVQFQLEPFLATNAERLPLGFQQRLAMACAVMHHPVVLFLDEPTSGVDPLTRREFWMRIHALAQEGTTVIVTTHFMDEAEYCDRLVLMFQGRIIAEGSPESIKASVASESLPSPTLEDAFIQLLQREQDHALNHRQSA